MQRYAAGDANSRCAEDRLKPGEPGGGFLLAALGVLVVAVLHYVAFYQISREVRELTVRVRAA